MQEASAAPRLRTLVECRRSTEVLLGPFMVSKTVDLKKGHSSIIYYLVETFRRQAWEAASQATLRKLL